MSDLVKELLCRSSDQDGIGWTPQTVVPVPAGLLHRAADRIEQLEKALREIATYEIEDGCPCSACHHSALARAALGEECA